MVFDILYRRNIPDRIPGGMQHEIDKLKRSKSKEACLRKAYDIMTKRYIGYRMMTYVALPNLFRKDLDWLWNRAKYVQCTGMNYIMRVLLVKSGFFTDKDIEFRWTMIWYISPHQYMKVRVDDKKTITLDIWNWAFGKGYGEYAHGFCGPLVRKNNNSRNI